MPTLPDHGRAELSVYIYRRRKKVYVMGHICIYIHMYENCTHYRVLGKNAHIWNSRHVGRGYVVFLCLAYIYSFINSTFILLLEII